MTTPRFFIKSYITIVHKHRGLKMEQRDGQTKEEEEEEEIQPKKLKIDLEDESTKKAYPEKEDLEMRKTKKNEPTNQGKNGGNLKMVICKKQDGNLQAIKETADVNSSNDLTSDSADAKCELKKQKKILIKIKKQKKAKKKEDGPAKALQKAFDLEKTNKRLSHELPKCNWLELKIHKMKGVQKYLSDEQMMRMEETLNMINDQNSKSLKRKINPRKNTSEDVKKEKNAKSKDSKIKLNVDKDSKIKPNVDKDAKIKLNVDKDSKIKPNVDKDSKIKLNVDKDSKDKNTLVKDATNGKDDKEKYSNDIIMVEADELESGGISEENEILDNPAESEKEVPRAKSTDVEENDEGVTSTSISTSKKDLGFESPEDLRLLEKKELLLKEIEEIERRKAEELKKLAKIKSSLSGLKSRSSENIPKKNPETVFDEPDIKLETVDLEPEILEEQEKPPKKVKSPSRSLPGHVEPKSGYMGSPVLPVNPGSVQNNINQKYAIHPSLTSNQYSAKHLYQHPANYKPGVHILPQYLQQHSIPQRTLLRTLTAAPESHHPYPRYDFTHKMIEKYPQLQTSSINPAHGFTSKPELHSTHGLNSKPELHPAHGLNSKPELHPAHGFNSKPELHLAHGFNSKPELHQAHGFNSKPELHQALGFNSKPELHPAHGFNSKPELNPAHGFNSKPELHPAHGFNSKPELHPAHGFNSKPELHPAHGFNSKPELPTPQIIEVGYQGFVPTKSSSSAIVQPKPGSLIRNPKNPLKPIPIRPSPIEGFNPYLPSIRPTLQDQNDLDETQTPGGAGHSPSPVHREIEEVTDLRIESVKTLYRGVNDKSVTEVDMAKLPKLRKYDDKINLLQGVPFTDICYKDMRALERFKEKKNKDVEILRLEPEEMRRIPKINKGLGRTLDDYNMSKTQEPEQNKAMADTYMMKVRDQNTSFAAISGGGAISSSAAVACGGPCGASIPASNTNAASVEPSLKELEMYRSWVKWYTGKTSLEQQRQEAEVSSQTTRIKSPSIHASVIPTAPIYSRLQQKETAKGISAGCEKGIINTAPFSNQRPLVSAGLSHQQKQHQVILQQQQIMLQQNRLLQIQHQQFIQRQRQEEEEKRLNFLPTQRELSLSPRSTEKVEKKNTVLERVRCEVCGKDAVFMCSACKLSNYCSVPCQEKDWSIHSVECIKY